LRHNDDTARLLLETNTEGYYDNDVLMTQVDKAIDIFEAKYLDAQALFFLTTLHRIRNTLLENKW